MAGPMASPYRILCVAGARPNFMKIAPIMTALRQFPDTFAPTIVHTGQHYERICGVLEYAEQEALHRRGRIGLQGLPAVRLRNISAYSLASERCDQLVGWTELTRSQLGWRHRLQHPDPLRHVHAQIRLRGLSALVTEPQGWVAQARVPLGEASGS